MSTIVFQGAEAALNARAQALEEVPGQQAGNLQGRKATHWSFYLLAAGSVAGAVAGIAAYVMSMPAISVIGAALCLTNAFGAYLVKKFSNYRVLEDYVNTLSSTVHEIAGKVDDLKEANRDLRRINDDLEESAKRWRQTVAEGESKIRKQADQIERLTRDIRKTGSSMSKVAMSIQKKLENTTARFSKDVEKMCNENDALGERVKQLASHVEENKEHVVRIAKEIDELDEHTNAYDKINQAFALQIEVLDSLFGVTREVYERAKGEIDKFKIEREKLEQIVPGVVQSSAQITEQGGKFEDIAKKWEEGIQKLNLQVEKIEKWKESAAYKEWREFKAWKNSPDYELFKQYKDGNK